MDLQQARQYVIELEQQLLDPAVCADTARFDALLDPSFVEYGASGLAAQSSTGCPCKTMQQPGLAAFGFRERIVAGVAILLTYGSTSNERTCNRSSHWVESTPGIWRTQFHQGTQTTPAN